MESGDTVGLVVLAGIVVVLLIAFVAWLFSNSRQSQTPTPWSSPTPSRPQPVVTSTSLRQQRAASSSGSGLEALFGLLVLGMAGIALAKFIESGGLSRLLNRIGQLPIDVNGRATTIAAAVNDEAYVRTLLMEAIQKRFDTLDGAGSAGAATIDVDGAAAFDIAQLLRDSVERRMKDRGII